MELQTCIARAVSLSNHVLMITDIEGKILFVNSAIEKLTGYAPRELIGQNVRIFRSGLQPQDFYDQMWESILRGEVWAGELINRKKNGETYHEHLTIVPLKEADGTVACFAATKRNIDEEIQIRQTLQNLQAHVQRGSSTQYYILKDISHKVRTTLNSILGFIGLISTQVGEEEKEYLTVIQNNGKQLLSNIDDLLQISRIQAGETPLTNEHVDLGEMIRQFCSEFESRAGKNRILSIPPDSPTTILADRARFNQAFLDIAENALKNSRNEAIVIQSLWQDNDTARIIIGDAHAWSGKNLRKELLAEFDYIEQDSWSALEESGINTIVTKSILELMGGTLSMLVSIDDGNLFVIRFPIQKK